MNRYFSRLAERSGVAVNTGTARPGKSAAHAEADWSEQSFETTVSSNANAAVAGDQIVGTRNESRAATASDLTQSSAGTNVRLSNSAMQSLDSAQEFVNPGDALTSHGSPATPETVSSDLLFSDHDQTTEKTSAKFSASGDSVLKHVFTAANKKNVSAFLDQNRSRSETAKSRTSAQILGTDAASISASETEMQPTSKRHAVPVRANPDLAIPETENSSTTPIIRANAMPAKQVAGTAGKVERVTSSPPQTAVLPSQSTRPGSRTSIEVNIGKIELEIFAPVTKPVAPPVSAPNSAPRPKPAAAFNPHRHYLRGR